MCVLNDTKLYGQVKVVNFIIYILLQLKKKNTSHATGTKKVEFWKFPGAPVVRAQCFHCWGPGFNPWSGNLRFHKQQGTAKGGKESQILLYVNFLSQLKKTQVKILLDHELGPLMIMPIY